MMAAAEPCSKIKYILRTSVPSLDMRRRSGFPGVEDVMSGIIKLKGDDLKNLSNKKGKRGYSRNQELGHKNR